jgi:hypothetical protein
MNIYQRVVEALLHERSDELTKEACEQCGQLVMCSYHSVLSVLSGGVFQRTPDGQWLKLPDYLASKQTQILNTPVAAWNCTVCKGPIDPTEHTVPHLGGFAHKQCTCRHQYWDLGYCIDCGIHANRLGAK